MNVVYANKQDDIERRGLADLVADAASSRIVLIACKDEIEEWSLSIKSHDGTVESMLSSQHELSLQIGCKAREI
jgi:hypothetical protein